MLYRISQLIGHVILSLYFRIRIEGKNNIPRTGAYVIVANHASFLDPFIVGTVVPRVIHFLTYAYFYYLPGCHWYCKRMHNIPLKKDGKDISAFKNALRVLKNGGLVGIFPEGRRSETGQLQQGQPGAALIALKAQVPILPIGIRGAYQALPKGARFPKPVPITISIGKPFMLTDYLPRQVHITEEIQQQAMDLILARIADLSCVTPEVTQKMMVPIE
jgi:1-acyl-sn-glycerol-3-phosphate acyltransferase